MYGYIYKTTNTINNKFYIGQKKSEKFLAEKYLGSGVYLTSAVNKYGAENFIVELLDTAESREELNEKEKYYIKLYDAQNLIIGYNIADGGDGFTGDHAWNKGLTKDIDNRLIQSQYTKDKRSESLKRAYKEGRHVNKYSEETRRIMSEKAKARPHPGTTTGRKSMTNGKINKMVNPDQFEHYLSLGYYFGKTMINSKPAWNKGLTKMTDDRVAKYTESRNKHFENGGSIGCYGVKGNTYAKKKTD